jgi:hypothetical protein
VQYRTQTEALRAVFLVFSLLALIAGSLLIGGATNTEDLFSWTIKPPLSAATLGAFYWSALVLMLPLAAGGPWHLARPAVYPVAAIAVLLLAATLIELETLDLDSFFGWFWLVVYSVVPILLGLAIIDQLRRPDFDTREPVAPFTPHLRVALGIEGAVMLALGAVLFALPEAANEVWPWPLGDLTSRVMGAFVLGIGMAAAIAVRENDLIVFRGSARAYAALGVLALLALLLHRDDLDGGALATGAYVGFLAAILATGLYGSFGRRPPQGIPAEAKRQPAPSAASASARS